MRSTLMLVLGCAVLVSSYHLTPVAARDRRANCVSSYQLSPVARSNCVMAAGTLTVKLTGCTGGVGVGLDQDNRVDMIREGSPAETSDLKIGDIVLQWNGIELYDTIEQQQRLLKDVVTPAESHTLLVSRAGSGPTNSLAAAAAAAIEQEAAAARKRTDPTDAKDNGWKARESWTDEKSSSWAKGGDSWKSGDKGSSAGSTWGDDASKKKW